MRIKVAKFGGSSLASAEQFKKVGHIIRSDKRRRYVVPSAPGKRFSSDIKVTDMLLPEGIIASSKDKNGNVLKEILSEKSKISLLK